MTSVPGYAGKVLNVDLTGGVTSGTPLDETTLRAYVGGTCLGIKYVFDSVRPGTQWDDPGNCLALFSGPLGATRIGGSGTFSVVTMGPLTNGIGATQANGFLGAYLKLSGFDGIVVSGRSPQWVYLYVHDGVAEIKEAGHLLGKDTWQTEDAIANELGHKRGSLSVASIGPAGENLVKFACILADKGHVAGHNGVGAVMGSKRLKAIAVARGKSPLDIKDRESLSAVSKECLENVKGTTMYDYGTLGGSLRMLERGALPIKNMTTSVWQAEPEKINKFTAKYIRDTYPGEPARCWACQINHVRMIRIPEGKYAGELLEEPDHEQFSAMGPLIGLDDLDDVMILAREVDLLGMDVNEAGWLIGMVMECYEKGIITGADTDGIAMSWGNVEATLSILKKTAHRQGFGNILAEGVMRAAKQIGRGAADAAVHSAKGNTPRTHDHRAIWSEMFSTCVSNVGVAEHFATVKLQPLGLTAGKDQFAPEEISTLEAKAKGATIFEDSLGVCKFNTSSDLERLCRAVCAATGWDFSVAEAVKVGRRAVNMARCFNLMHGISPSLDIPSPRYGSTPQDGKCLGRDSRPVWQSMLDNYYKLMGWDQRGVPLPETLKDLGLEPLGGDISVASQP
ncbi:MAG: hypothetical protein HYX90_07330 [Chloroflexi bacterium]|nr:hypothetical protein [Chloroflexota bacterium]